MGQKVLRAERRSRRGWPRPARSTKGYGLCSFLNMADAHGLAWRWWFICPRTNGVEREIVSAGRRHIEVDAHREAPDRPISYRPRYSRPHRSSAHPRFMDASASRRRTPGCIARIAGLALQGSTPDWEDSAAAASAIGSGANGRIWPAVMSAELPEGWTWAS